MLAKFVHPTTAVEPTFSGSNIYAFFYLRRITIIAIRTVQTQGYRRVNHHGNSCNIDGESRQIGWFYRQLMCYPANLVLYFPVNSHAQQKFLHSI